LADQPLRIAAMEARTLVVLAHAIDLHRHEAHHLDAARDHAIVRPRDDALRGEVERLLRGAAFAIERDARCCLIAQPLE
jgi:hypothetical protein